MSLVQISKQTGTTKRVPNGQTPVIELDLEAHERVISIELRESWFGSDGRVTNDWYWTAYIETRL